MESATLTKISACPFCGGDATVGKTTYQEGSMVPRLNGGQMVWFFVSCAWCGASNAGLIGHKTELRAIRRWNTRSAPRAKEELVRSWTAAECVDDDDVQDATPPVSSN